MKKLSLIAAVAAALGLAASSATAAFVTIGKNDGVNDPANNLTDGNLISANSRWTRDNVYIITRLIFIEPGVTLTIEPGTIIRGVTAANGGQSLQPGTLVVARGGKIVANGTADDPIIFTSIDDPNVVGGTSTIPSSYVNSVGETITVSGRNYSPSGPSGANGFAYNSQFGGLVVLGNAYVANYNTGAPPTADSDSDGLPDEPFTPVTGTGNNVGGYGRDFIEGIDSATVDNANNNGGNGKFYGTYGGKSDSENNGVYRFVSVRYGGFKIGTNNELNAITFGGVGSGTVLEFCEAAFNLDDGFEFFGGKFNTRHLYSLYNLDDSFDTDEGFRGQQQFWAVVQGNVNVARSGYSQNNTTTGVVASDAFYDNYFEMDGAEGNNNGAVPYSTNNIWNVTVVGSGNTGSQISVVQDARLFLNNAALQNTRDLAQVSQTTLDPIGTIADVVNAHYFFDGNTATSENKTFTDLVAPTSTTITEETSAVLSGAAFFTKNGLDLRLPSGSAARVEDGVLPPSGLVQVDYAGYMRDNQFLSGWSIAEYMGVLDSTNIARPRVSVSGTTNPVISFASAGSSVKYVIEKSTDRRSWSPVNSGNTLSGAGTISHTDTSSTLGSTPVYYRVYAL